MNKKLYYDELIGEFVGYKVYTANHLPIEKHLVNDILVNILLSQCKIERARFGADGQGENRGEYLSFKARTHWEDKEMAIIDCRR